MKVKSISGLLLAASLTAMMAAGCQKDQLTGTLQLSMESFNSANKAYMAEDGLNPIWHEGDEIMLNGSTVTNVYNVDGNNAKAEEYDESAPYYAIYPAELVSSGHSTDLHLAIPRVQKYMLDDQGRQIIKAPMGSYSTTTYLHFTNLGAMLRIEVNHDIDLERDLTVDYISVKSKDSRVALWGDATVDDIEDRDIRQYTMTESPLTHDSIVLAGKNGVNELGQYSSMNIKIGRGKCKYVYVYIPCIADNVDNLFTIRVFCHDENGRAYSYSMTQKPDRTPDPYNGDISLNHIAKVAFFMLATEEHNVEPPVPEGALTRLFSVAIDRQVYIAQGNLQYTTQGSHETADGQNTTGTFRFALEQYDIIGNGYGGSGQYGTVPGSTNSNFGAAGYTGWVDLFSWGTSGYNGHSPLLHPNWGFGVSYGGINSDGSLDVDGDASAPIAGTNYDWGVYNAISNGGDAPGVWRTPTGGDDGELNWLFYKRIENNQVTIIDGRPYSFAEVKVTTENGQVIRGFFVFPDIYTWPTNYSAEIPKPQVLNAATSDWNGSHIYTYEEYKVLANSGALFLPWGGYRINQTVYSMSNNLDAERLNGNGTTGGFITYENESCYWTGTTEAYTNANDARCHTNSFHFRHDQFDPTYECVRHFGHSVRLVRDFIPQYYIIEDD